MIGQRSFERYVVVTTPEVIVEPFGSAMLRDISIAGARVEHSGPIELDQRVRLIARLEPAKMRMSFNGLVVWSTLLDPELQVYATGIQFDESAEALGSVLEMLRTRHVARRIETPPHLSAYHPRS